MIKTLKLTLILAIILGLLYFIYPVEADIFLESVGNGKLHVARGPYISFPRNTTYDSGLLTLFVEINGPFYGGINYSVTYRLDGQEKKTIVLTSYDLGSFITSDPEKDYKSGSVVLPTLSNGSHQITVQVEATFFGNDRFLGPYNETGYDSQTVYFTVLSPLTLLGENEIYDTTNIPLRISPLESQSLILIVLFVVATLLTFFWKKSKSTSNK
jgi:hypothetical protein